jgi:hypothetical protein
MMPVAAAWCKLMNFATMNELTTQTNNQAYNETDPLTAFMYHTATIVDMQLINPWDPSL